MTFDPFSAVKTVVELWSRYAGYKNEKKEKKDSDALVDRFLRVYKAHGVLPAQIPRVLGMEKELSLRDILSTQRLAECLNSEMLEKTCELYGVQREWLEGDNIPPYPSRSFYNNPALLVEFLETLTQRHDFIQLWCFKNEDKPLEKLGNGELFAVLVADSFQLGEKSVEKFYPIDSDWPWGHVPARLDFKTLVYVCQRFGIYALGRSAPVCKIEAVVNGREFPSNLYRYTKHWHPDDYIYSQVESAVAKEPQEAMLVREILKERGVFDRLPPISSSSPEKVTV
jgi:hypothetical protein